MSTEPVIVQTIATRVPIPDPATLDVITNGQAPEELRRAAAIAETRRIISAALAGRRSR
ncbi:hypothetical protein [Planobispora rosea]|uniref:hypothetical protein n=1 Tax=Planobispora rosea TaxID=35762 RepID=UPI00159EFBC8|nr:hypothetical protein [Planobispora rosea]